MFMIVVVWILGCPTEDTENRLWDFSILGGSRKESHKDTEGQLYNHNSAARKEPRVHF